MKRSSAGSFQDFYRLLQTVHQIPRVDVLLGYTDVHGDLLPINNDDNYHKALSSANPLLRVIIQKKGKWELEKGTGSILHVKGDEPRPAVPLVPHLGCASGGGSQSHTCQPPLWNWRWWHQEAPRTPLGPWHLCRLSLTALPHGKGTHASPALCTPASKGKSSQFTPLKLHFPDGLVWAPGKHRIAPVSAGQRAPSAPCPEAVAAVVLAELPGYRVLQSFWWWEEACLLPGSPGTHPDHSGVFPESNFLMQEHEISMITASQ